MKKNSALNKVTSIVNSALTEPELFLSVQPKLADKLRKIIKKLYDDSDCEKSSKALKELYVENCDEEQIWQQIELQNESSHISISQVLASNDLSTLPLTLSLPDESSQSDSDPDEDLKNEENDEENSEMELSANDEELFEEKRKQQMKLKKKTKPSIVDDTFFKLDDMNDFLLREDKREDKTEKNDLDGSDAQSDEESVDLFEDYPEDDDEEEEEEENDEGHDLMYGDFFDSPEGEDEKEGKRKFSEIDEDAEERGDENESERRPMLEQLHKKRVKFNLTNDSDETDSLENKESPQMQENDEDKTNYEIREERLKKKIEKLENENLQEKSWQMKGEISAKDRPEYSLLEEYLETDVTSRPAPVITEETTEKLEDIIIRRIKDKAWDDVEKKFKPVDTPMEYKKKLVLDQEKSKLSLAQIYENEYLQQKKALNPDDNEDADQEEPKEHKEIRELVTQLFNKLDALSNYHYTPRPAKPEIKIVSNVPAINMEEVAPVATTDATLLAPEEIKPKPRGDLIGATERTKTDMKRSRRHKKLRQRQVQKAKEQREKETPLVKKKFSKKEGNKKDTKATTEKPTKNITSTAVFSQLQDEVRSAIKAKKNATKKPKTKNTFSAAKLKL